MKRFIFIMLLSLSVSLHAETADIIIANAVELVGTPYRYGGSTPSGFDCSGLLHFLYNEAVTSFPRRAIDQSRAGSYVDKSSLLAGDLVFYATGSNNTITHAALFVGNNTVIQAVSAGPQTGVVITDMDESYWAKRYVTSRRVLSPASQSKTPINVVKEKVIDSQGDEKTVVTLGDRQFALLSWEEWMAQEQALFDEKKDQDSGAIEQELSDFEKWKRENNPQ